jgi:hypothetical protein
MLFLLILILPFFVSQVESGTSTNTLYAHAETTTIGGVNYYLHKLSSGDGPGITLLQSIASTGRKLAGKFVYQLTGVSSIPVSTWIIYYRAYTGGGTVHCDVDILIRKSDGTIRETKATNVANSANLGTAYSTVSGTYSWTAYTVVDQTDYLEIDYYFEVTVKASGKSAYLRIDDNTLAIADQTKIANVMFTYPNQAPVASFTFSPSNPLIYDTVTFDASASYDPDGSIVSYKWDFGDGNITTVTNPIITHVYPTAASTVNYTVTLTVTDNEGSTGFTTKIVPVTNPSILHVSLPVGTYVGPDPDNWLSQCWLLNITGLSGTFTIRVNNTHASYVSYNTHLIIALNNGAYNYLSSLTVDSTTIPPSSFTYGTPQPYGFTLTWENDVYPTWFSDIYVVGDINPKSYKDVTVAVTFSNTTGVRMHFDAYGSADPFPPPPTSKGHVTDNPHEKDSTVLFSLPAVVQYYLTVTSPYGTVGGQGWYISGSIAYATLNTSIVDYGNGTRRVFLNWSGDASGTNYAQSNPILMDSNKTAIAVWKTQYQITVTASPSGALGGTFKVTYTQCGTTYTNVQKTTSWTEWVDGTTTVTVSEPQDIVNGYKFDSYTPSATVTMDQAKTITLVYKAIQSLSVSISPTSAKIKVGESVTFTSTVSGGVPGYSYQWYLNGTEVSGAIYATWTFTPVTSGTYNVYLNVTDSVYKTAKSNIASVTVAPPLTVSISPTSASILVGQSVAFTSTPSGGYPLYSYQWYLGGVQVSGATSGTWTFTPTASGIYYVYLQVKDANNNVAQSETAKITVIPPSPVGGYSISLAKRTPTSYMAVYTMLIALFATILGLTKRKRK